MLNSQISIFQIAHRVFYSEIYPSRSKGVLQTVKNKGFQAMGLESIAFTGSFPSFR